MTYQIRKIKEYIKNESMFWEEEFVEDIDRFWLQSSVIDEMPKQEELLEEDVEELIDYAQGLYRELEDEEPWPSPQDVYGWGGLGVGLD